MLALAGLECLCSHGHDGRDANAASNEQQRSTLMLRL